MMMRRKSHRILFFFLLACGILLLVLGNIFAFQRREFFFFVSSPVQKIFWRAGEWLSNELRPSSVKRNEENTVLWLDNQALRAEIARLKALEEENKNMKEAWEEGLQKDFSLLPVRAMGISSFEDVLFLEAGAKDGIKKGMPVVSSQKVLYGFVEEVFGRSSRVRLLSHQESSVVVSVAEKNVLGIARGLRGGKVILDLIPRETELQEGDLILTAPQEDYPEGLLVGLVQKIVMLDAGPFLQAKIQLFFKKAGFLQLFVIKDF